MPAPPVRPTVADFRAGTPYGTAYVAAFLGRTKAWVRQLVLLGRFPGAFRPAGSSHWMIPGEAVVAYVGAKNLDAARAAESASLPTPAEEKRQADEALARIRKRAARRVA